MVRYKYIGRTNWQCGKTLWEIIGNLKDYGVGRLVTRGTWQHYEQPSFLKIIKAEPYSLAEEDEVSRNDWKIGLKHTITTSLTCSRSRVDTASAL